MKEILKKFLTKRGYHFFKEGFMPKGIYFESDLASIIRLDDFKLVMDVGAYHGTMTQLFLKIFPNANIITVEPSIHSFNHIKSLFINNSRVNLQNCGIGREKSIITFKLFDNGELNSFKNIDRDEAEAVDSIEVNVFTIDDVLHNSNNGKKPVDFLKIDVEGFEMEVLSGADKLFRDNEIGCILIEAGFCDDDERHTPFKSIAGFLEKQGFTFYGLYDLYHYRKKTELLFANALFINEEYLKKRRLLK